MASDVAVQVAPPDAAQQRHCLTELSQLLLTRNGLTATLTQVADLAVRAIPGAADGGVVLLESQHVPAVVVTSSLAGQIAAIRTRVGEGPMLSAVTVAATCVSSNLGGDSRWPHFGPQVGRLGVHSALALPLVAAGETIGSVSVYAGPKHAFGADAVRLGEEFAAAAAVCVANARILAGVERLAGQLDAAMRAHATIDQALGALMAAQGWTAEEAFDWLRRLSRSRSVRMSQLAQEVLAQATRRARRARSAAASPGSARDRS